MFNLGKQGVQLEWQNFHTSLDVHVSVFYVYTQNTHPHTQLKKCAALDSLVIARRAEWLKTLTTTTTTVMTKYSNERASVLLLLWLSHTMLYLWLHGGVSVNDIQENLCVCSWGFVCVHPPSVRYAMHAHRKTGCTWLANPFPAREPAVEQNALAESCVYAKLVWRVWRHRESIRLVYTYIVVVCTCV